MTDISSSNADDTMVIHADDASIGLAAASVDIATVSDGDDGDNMNMPPRTCSGRINIQYLHALAKLRNGICLSETVESVHSTLEWKCDACDQSFAMRVDSVIYRNSWCMSCTPRYKREAIFRHLLEKMTSLSFPSVRPDWLRNPKTNRNLEIDCFSESLMLGFEINGEQHYQPIEAWGGERVFREIQARDQTKRILCKQKGAALIPVHHSIKVAAMQDFIRSCCQDHNIMVKNDATIDDFALIAIWSKEWNIRCAVYAESHEGRCLTPHVIFGTDMVSWCCKVGHQWESILDDMLDHQSWCMRCHDRRQREETVKIVTKLVEARGGKLIRADLDAVPRTLCTVSCEFGHEWTTTTHSFQAGKWCGSCCGQPTLTLEDLKKAAAKKNGECLSSMFTTLSARYDFRCVDKHEWTTTGDNVRRGSWCPQCATAERAQKNRKPATKPRAPRIAYSIELMQQCARKLGGQCLSTTFDRCDAKLLWECQNKHQWQSTASAVAKHGYWCHLCAAAAARGVVLHNKAQAKPPKAAAPSYARSQIQSKAKRQKLQADGDLSSTTASDELVGICTVAVALLANSSSVAAASTSTVVATSRQQVKSPTTMPTIPSVSCFSHPDTPQSIKTKKRKADNPLEPQRI